MIYDLIIIGGGVSGVSAYISLKRKNKNKTCLIIEHKEKLLKKLNMTGNGKCNFTNGYLDKSIYVNGDNFKDILNTKGLNKILNFFDYLNIKYFSDNENRYYPLSESAKTVSNKMLEKVSKDDILNNTEINSIKYINNLYNIDTTNGIYQAKNILISCGSKNYSNSGSDGSLFDKIIGLKHTFTDIYPSNIWINVKEKDFTKRVSGLRVKAKLSLFNDNKLISEELGELLFKDSSLSGIVSFNLSNSISELYKNKANKNIKILVDFAPTLDDSLDDLYSYLNPLIASTLLSYLNKYNSIYDLVKKFEFNVTSLGDFNYAQVCCGGIKLDEINQNFESKINKGLYFAGDILDVSAPCGGYNLSFAMLSGMKVGEEID